MLKTFNLHQRKKSLVFLCWWIDQTAGVDFDTYCLRVIWPHVISFQLNCKTHGPLCLQTHLQLNVFSREIRLSQKYKIHFEHVENKKTKYIGSCTSCHSLYMFFLWNKFRTVSTQSWYLSHYDNRCFVWVVRQTINQPYIVFLLVATGPDLLSVGLVGFLDHMHAYWCVFHLEINHIYVHTI